MWWNVTVVALCAASCSGRHQAGEVEVTYNCAANASEIRELNAEIPAFADSTGITIALQPFTGQEKLYAMIAAGQAPDIFYTNTVVRDRLAAEGRVLDLRRITSGDPFLARLWPDIYADGFAADSGLYSIGNWSFTAGVYYNRDLFESEGIPYPDTSWTWQEMTATARRLCRHSSDNPEADRFGIFIGSHFVELLEQLNGAPLPHRSLLLRLPEESLEAYRSYIALMREGLMPDLRRVQALGMQAVQLMQSGKVAMLVEAIPSPTLFETLRMRWGIAPLPRFGAKPVRYFRSGSGGLSISAQAAHPHEAWRAIKWIIAGAKVYQPNPVLRDVDFVGGWETRYPRLVGTGFREVWNWSLEHNGGDPRFFVRFSSWTSGTIMERLQPLLDQLWSGHITVEDLARSVPDINKAARLELERIGPRKDLAPGFLEEVKKELSLIEHGADQQADK
jgi:ABC-type glycerol-3-phosphate transport system substrate-binding protein